MSKFILLSGMRTGSNWLRDLLNNHPDILCHNVIFSNNRKIKNTLDHYKRRHRIKHFFINPGREKIINNYLSHLDEISSEYKSWGIKIHFHHLMSHPELISIIKDKSFKLIFLGRRNLLKQAISLEIARMTNEWTRKQGAEQEKYEGYHFDESLVKVIVKLEKEEQYASQHFQDYDPFQLTYEKLIEEKDTVLEKIFKLLEVDLNLDIQSDIKKQNTSDLRELVLNFDEMKRFLSGSAYEKYLPS